MRRIIYSATMHDDGYDHAVYDDAGDYMVHLVSVDAENHDIEVAGVDCSYAMSRADAGPIGMVLACAYAEPVPPVGATWRVYFAPKQAYEALVVEFAAGKITLTILTASMDSSRFTVSADEARTIGLTLLRAAAAAEEDAI